MPDIVAIHQPDFFPWLGNFNKFFLADKFVILDDVQYVKKGSNWSNRVRLVINNKPGWITMPVVRNYHGFRSYKEMEIDNSAEWRKKIKNSIKTNYGKSKFFDELFPQIIELIDYKTDSLLEYNLNAYFYLISQFKMDKNKIIMSSSIDHFGKSTDLLIEIVKAVNGNVYLCGGGASGYQEDYKFQNAGLTLIYQNFKHPVYPQIIDGGFIAGLSVIDALMNCGVEDTFKLICSKD